jgi:hypothetical protein
VQAQFGWDLGQLELGFPVEVGSQEQRELIISFVGAAIRDRSPRYRKKATREEKKV